MASLTLPESEELLLNWAKSNEYAVRPRIFRNEHRDTHIDGENSKWQAYQRDILIPNGIIVYSMFEFDWNTFYQIDSEKDIPQYLSRDGNCKNYIEWFLGKKFENWRLDEAPGYTRDRRKEQAEEKGLLVVSGILFALYDSNGNLTDKKDFNDKFKRKISEKRRVSKLLKTLKKKIEKA